MNHYVRKEYQLSNRSKDEVLAKIGSTLGSTDELARRVRQFYKQTHISRFNEIVKQSWFEQTLTYDGVRRNGRHQNGFGNDSAFGFFFRGLVGISQKPITDGFYATVIPTYFKDFFPNFSDHDPDIEPEYFKYPYKNITLDHLGFVYKVHNRLELLKHADENAMSIHDFENYATKKSFAYSETQPMVTYRDREGGEQEVFCYTMGRSHSFIPYIRDMRK
jgi:hypothetical protein